MANYSSLLAAVNAAITANGTGAITGPVLNTVLQQMIVSLGQGGYIFKGRAIPTTDPGSPDQNVFYIATTPGTYTNFSSIVVAAGECAILKGSGTSWSKEATGIDLVSVSQNISTGHTDINIGSDSYPVASVEEVSQLGQYRHITKLAYCDITLTYNNGQITAKLVNSGGYIYHENGYAPVNLTSFENTFQLGTGLNVIYFDTITSEIKRAENTIGLTNAIIIDVFYSYNGSIAFYSWFTPIINHVNISTPSTLGYQDISKAQNIESDVNQLKPAVNGLYKVFAKVTRLVYCTISLEYNNGQITAKLVKTDPNIGLIYHEFGYVSFTENQNEVLNVLSDINIVYFNNTLKKVQIASSVNSLKKDDIILEVFYAYNTSPAFSCWSSKVVNKTGALATISNSVSRYFDPINDIDLKAYRRATTLYGSTNNISISYDASTHELTVSTNGGHLYDTVSYCALTAQTKVFELNPGRLTIICWNDSSNEFKKFESSSTGTPLLPGVTAHDIVLEIFYNNNYLLSNYPAIWTTPWIIKTGFPAEYENGFNCFSNSYKVSNLDDRVTALENTSLNSRAFPYSLKIFRRVGCIGDSYTKGYIYPSGGSVTEDENYAWPHYLSNITKNVYTNFGVSGSTAKGWMMGAAKLAQVQAQGNKCQAYIVGLMINDRNDAAWNQYYTPVGVIGDIGTDNDTYYAWYYKLIQAIILVNPSAPIFCNTCPAYANNDAYNQAVRDIVNYCHTNGQKVYLNDLASDTYKNTKFFTNPTFIADAVNGHYTAIGYEFMAECLKEIISDTINANQAEFQTVHLIPFDAAN